MLNKIYLFIFNNTMIAQINSLYDAVQEKKKTKNIDQYSQIVSKHKAPEPPENTTSVLWSTVYSRVS